jgi:SRSO17 transposase
LGVGRKTTAQGGFPDDVTFKTEPEIALEQLQGPYETGLSDDDVVMDTSYGANTDLRMNITEMGLTGISPYMTVWEPRKGVAGANEIRRTAGDRQN